MSYTLYCIIQYTAILRYKTKYTGTPLLEHLVRPDHLWQIIKPNTWPDHLWLPWMVRSAASGPTMHFATDN